jgi:hypothetical protein
MKKNPLYISEVEKQILLDLLPFINEDARQKESTIRSFKWMANVPQVGEEYTKNLNVFQFEDKAIKEIQSEKQSRINLINKLIRHEYYEKAYHNTPTR